MAEPKNAATDSEAPALQTKRILLVDDHADTREMYALLLRDRGYLVSEAPDGPSALATLRGVRLYAAVVDISLPGMDGHELARRIRAEATEPRVGLIAVTGHGLPEDLARSRLAGFDVHLVKPVAPDDLYMALDSLDAGPAVKPHL